MTDDTRRDQLANAKAVMDEFVLPDSEIDRLGAELRDSVLCADPEAREAVRVEAERLQAGLFRLRALWTQACESIDAGNEERLAETARCIRYTARAEFERLQRRDRAASGEAGEDDTDTTKEDG